MKPLKSYLRTGALAVGLLGITAAPALAGASPAAAATTAYGSGAAVQKGVQEAWESHWTPPAGDGIKYTPTTSLGGQLEFGLKGGALDPTQDATANPKLDGFVGTDSAPTPAEAEAAATAAETGKATESLLSIPVAQVAEVIELNIPSNITLNSAQNIDLTNKLAEQLFAGKTPAPASGDYLENTWGALLEDSGLTKVAGAPTVGQFSDPEKLGGKVAISQVLRSNGAGATLTLKQYLSYAAVAAGTTDWTGITIDESTEGTNEWPSGATIFGRFGSDSTQAEKVAETAGRAGYGTLGAALGKSFTDSPTASGNHKLIARLQDNGVVATGIKYANAEAASGGSNVYSGASINISGTYNPGVQSGAGNWVVPNAGEAVNPTGQWATNGETASSYTHGWDIDAYDDSGKPLTPPYPLDIVLWDLSWDHPVWGTGKLKNPLYPKPTGVESVEETVASYLQYVTGTGQGDTTTPHFAPLPTSGAPGLANIKADAATIAGAL